jgi:CheY-like chemotaxis protein
MVDGLAEQSGGRFVIKSRLGEGTTAELWLPAGKKRAVQPEPEPASVEVPGEHRGLRVIVVDDDFLILTITVAMVEDLGHTAFSAASAKEALQILRREAHVDAVVTDQAMPHMTGVQLASAIRDEWPDLPVILATGYAELDTGARSHLRKLSKPFTEAQLAAELAIVPRRGEEEGVVSLTGSVTAPQR